MSARGTSNVGLEGGSRDRATACFLSFVQTGLVEDLEQALLLCSPPLHRFASTLRRAADAGDLVNDTFLVAITRADQFDGTQELLPWMYGILRNAARARHGRRWAKTKSYEGSQAVAMPSNEPGPDEIVERREWRSRTEDCVARLSEPYRSVVSAHLFEGEQPVQIANRMGRSSSTVRTQISRGMHELRRQMPAPLLFGLVAMMAARNASAGTAVVVPRMRSKVMLATVAVALVALTAWTVWPGEEVPLPNSADAPPAVESVVAVETKEEPSPAKIEEVVRVPVQQSKGRTVVLHLRFADGTPPVGMPVLLTPDNDSRTPANLRHLSWRREVSDENGTVTFEDVPEGVTTIQTFDTAPGVSLQFSNGRFEDTLKLKVPCWLQVAVRDESGNPVADAEVYCSMGRGIEVPGYHASTTDAAGVALVYGRNLPMHYWVRAKGFVNSQPYTVHDAGSKEQPIERVVTLVRGDRTCSGYVRNPNGAPIAGAVVAAWSEADERIPTSYTHTDESGRFTISGMSDAAWHAAAIVDGLACNGTRMASPADEAVVLLSKGGRVTGKLPLDETGAFGRRVLSVSLTDPGADPFFLNVAEVAPDGSYELEHLRPGPHRIQFHKNSTQPSAVRQVTVVEGCEHRLQSDGEAEEFWNVRVVDSNGDPIPGSYVQMSRSHPDRWGGFVREAVTNEDGFASMPFVADGEFDLTVHLHEETQRVDLPSARLSGVRTGEVVEIVVADAARRLGIVTGRMAPTLLANAGSVELHQGGCAMSAPLRPDGSFRFDNVPAGTYRLRHRSSDEQAFVTEIGDCEAEAGETLDLGVVADVEVGVVAIQLAPELAPLPVTVRLRDSAGRTTGGWIVKGGEDLKFALCVGRYELLVPNADATESTVPFEIAADLTSDVKVSRRAGKPCRIELKIERVQSPCSARATLSGGPGAPIDLQLEHDLISSACVRELDLLPGEYAIEVRAPWGKPVRGILHVREDDDDVQTFSFVRG